MESSAQQDIHNESGDATAIVYPPKFIKETRSGNVWLRSFLSLALYLILGYYIFPGYGMLLIITAIVVFHELGHFAAMKYYGYSDLGIFFIPLLGAYVSGTKREVSQKQSAVILLAGPLPGILLGILFYFIAQKNPDIYFIHVSLHRISLLMIFLNLVNLLPIYPMDGGQLLNRVFLDEDGWLSKVFLFISIALLVWIAIKLKFYVLLIFPLMLLMRMRSDKQYTTVDKKIEEQGINADTSYEGLTDEDYWKIRTVLIEELPSFKDIPPGPPYQFHANEDKIMSIIQSLLHRHLVEDVSLAGKFFILVIWLLALASPWLINMDLSFFRSFGF